MKKDITPRNDKGNYHGLWELYWTNEYFKEFYINGKESGYAEFYINDDRNTLELTFHL